VSDRTCPSTARIDAALLALSTSETAPAAAMVATSVALSACLAAHSALVASD
jgi:hypothetical protein